MSEAIIGYIIGFAVTPAIAVVESHLVLAAARRERLKTRIVVCIGGDPTGMPTAADLAERLPVDVDGQRLERALAELLAEGAIKAYTADGLGTYVAARGDVARPLHYQLKRRGEYV